MGKFGNRIYLTIFALLFAIISGVCANDKFITVSAETQADIKIHYIDVGQGDASFIEFGDGKTMLIDGGEADYGNRVVKYIKNLGHTKIDYMIATHSDSDHIGGLITVLKKLEVGTIYRPFTISINKHKEFQDELYQNFAQNLDKYQVETNELYAEFLSLAYTETVGGEVSNIKIVSSGENILSEDANNPYMVRFFMPRADEAFSTNRINNGFTVLKHEDNNDSSAVVEVITTHSKFLFMGDLTSVGETEMLSKLTGADKTQLASVSVLKVGHHGAKTSTSKELLNLINPKFAVFSVGEDNEYGHPASSVVERLVTCGSIIYRTDESGTIIVEEIGGVLYFSNKETKSFFQENSWILYLVLGLLIVGIVVVTIVFTKLNSKKQNKNRIEIS